MKKKHPPGLRGWTDIGSDVNWEDYGGKWAKKAKDGSWYVIDFTNMVEACGKEAEDCPYVCEVKRVDLSQLTEEQLKQAYDCCGVDLDEVEAKYHEVVKIEACVGYGFYQPLESYSGAKWPARIRAQARRYAETCMRDAALLADRLARPVNKIGSTAEEYGRGDIDSALDRGPFDTGKNLMRRLHGLPSIEGGTL